MMIGMVLPVVVGAMLSKQTKSVTKSAQEKFFAWKEECNVSK